MDPGVDNAKSKGGSNSEKDKSIMTILPIQNEWPPLKLGLVPTATSSVLAIPGLKLVEKRILSNLSR